MRRRNEDKKSVYRALTMVMQFGLNMLVPISMMTIIGIWLDRRFETEWCTIILFIIGAVAGGQNIYRMAKSIAIGDDREEQNISNGNHRKSEK